jgi:hypothetical protein
MEASPKLFDLSWKPILFTKAVYFRVRNIAYKTKSWAVDCFHVLEWWLMNELGIEIFNLPNGLIS